MNKGIKSLLFILIIAGCQNDSKMANFDFTINGQKIKEFGGIPRATDEEIVLQHDCSQEVKLKITNSKQSKDFTIDINGEKVKNNITKNSTSLILDQSGLNVIKICNKSICKKGFVNCLSAEPTSNPSDEDGEILTENQDDPIPTGTYSDNTTDIIPYFDFSYSSINNRFPTANEPMNFTVNTTINNMEGLSWEINGEKIKVLDRKLRYTFDNAGNYNVKLCLKNLTCKTKTIIVNKSKVTKPVNKSQSKPPTKPTTKNDTKPESIPETKPKLIPSSTSKTVNHKEIRNCTHVYLNAYIEECLEKQIWTKQSIFNIEVKKSIKLKSAYVYSDGDTDVYISLKENGIYILQNQSYYILKGESKINLANLDIPEFYFRENHKYQLSIESENANLLEIMDCADTDQLNNSHFVANSHKLIFYNLQTCD